MTVRPGRQRHANCSKVIDHIMMTGVCDLMKSNQVLILGITALGLGAALGVFLPSGQEERPVALERSNRLGAPAVRPSSVGVSVPVRDAGEAAASAPVAPGALDRLLAALDLGDDAHALVILEGSADLFAAPDPDALDRLIRACRGGHAAPLRAALIYQLATADLESLRAVAPEIVRFDPEPEVRRAAIQAAAELRGDEMRRAICDAFSAGDPAVRADAVSALACLKGEEPAAFDRVAAALRAEPDAPARAQMARALASLDDARVDPLLRELGLDDAVKSVSGPKILIAD